jgi:hypothetical protein
MEYSLQIRYLHLLSSCVSFPSCCLLQEPWRIGELAASVFWSAHASLASFVSASTQQEVTYLPRQYIGMDDHSPTYSAPALSFSHAPISLWTKCTVCDRCDGWKGPKSQSPRVGGAGFEVTSTSDARPGSIRSDDAPAPCLRLVLIASTRRRSSRGHARQHQRRERQHDYLGHGRV